jgi:hypothetical protein
MKKIYLIILLAIAYQAATAQVPGYMGKRMLASYNFCPGFSLFQFPVQDLPKTRTGFFPKHCLNVDYVVSRQTMIGLNYEYLSAKPLADQDIKDYFADNSVGLTPGFKTLPQSFANHNIGVNFTFFSKSGGTVAPLGNYIKLKIYYSTYNVNQITQVNTNPSYYTNDIAYISQFHNNYVYHSYGIGLGYGSVRIIANHVTLDFGGELNYALNSLQTNYGTVQSQPTDQQAIYTYTPGQWDKTLQSFLLANFLGTFKIGVGGLLF